MSKPRISAGLLVYLAFGGSVACRPPAEHGVEHRPQGPISTEAVVLTDGGAEAGPSTSTLCAPTDGRCVSADMALVCTNGQLIEQTCAAGSVCLGTACLSLTTADGKTLDKEQLWAPFGEGWFNAWTSVGPIIGPMGDGNSPFSPDAGPDLAPKALCAKEGRVDVHDKLESKKNNRGTTHQRLSGHLIVGRAGPLALALGFAGTIRVLVDGKRVFEGTSDADPPPFRDEKRAVVEFDRGVHRLEVLVEQATNAATSLWIRARAPGGGPAQDLLFAQDAQARCAPTDLLSSNVFFLPAADGFAVDARPTFLGLGPRQPGELPYRVEMGPGSKEGKGAKTADMREITKGVLAKPTKESPTPTLSFVVPNDKAGNYELRIRLGEPPTNETIVPIIVRPNLHQRILTLADKRLKVENTSISRGDKDSLIYLIEDLLDELMKSDPDTPWMKKRTEEAEELVATAEKGKPPYEGRTGLQRKAYRSPLDGRLQPYALFVPHAYKPGGKALPLVVAAHGLNNTPEAALRVVTGEAPQGAFNSAREARHFGGLPDFGAFVVAPWQYGNSGQRHLGEADLLRVVEEVRAAYPINDKRISITGYSLGGTVAFVLPLHYPDVFSTSGPLCGYPNLLDWESIRKPAHKPWEDVLLSKRYIVNWAENGLHVPMFMIHGGKDEPRRSEIMAKRYQALGYAYDLDVQEELDHNVWDYGYGTEKKNKDGDKEADLTRRLIGKKKPEAPEHVRFVTGEFRYDRAYWVRVLGLGSLDKFADIDARYSKKDATITVQTKYVQSFAIELKQLLLKKEPTVTINGKTIAGPMTGDVIYFVQQGSEFVVVADEPSREGKKRAGVSGPLDDMDRHARLIVYGTQDPEQVEENRMVAEHFASFDTFAARYPVKSDADVTEEEINAKSLVLIGNSKSNRWTALFESQLPVKFESGALTFRGKRYEGMDVGLSFIHPHPRNAQEYVVVHAGVGVVGTLASRHLPRFSPDFLVYDSRMTAQRGGHLLDQRQVLEGGYFDLDWK